MRHVFELFNLGTGLVIAFLASIALQQYFSGNEAKVEKYQQLQQNGIATIARLDPEYKEVNVTVQGITATVYYTPYSFEVKGESFEGTYYFTHPDSLRGDMVEIYYLPDMPKINAADVERELEKAQENADSKSDLWFGLGGNILAIILILLALRKLGVRLGNKQKPAE